MSRSFIEGDCKINHNHFGIILRRQIGGYIVIQKRIGTIDMKEIRVFLNLIIFREESG